MHGTVNVSNLIDLTPQCTRLNPSPTLSSQNDSKATVSPATQAAATQLPPSARLESKDRVAEPIIPKGSQSQSTIKVSNPIKATRQFTSLDLFRSSQIDSKASASQVARAIDTQVASNSPPENYHRTKEGQSQSTVNDKNPNNSTHQPGAIESSAIPSSQANSKGSGSQVAGAVDRQLSSNSPLPSNVKTHAGQSQSAINNKKPNNSKHQSASLATSPSLSSQIDPKVSGHQVARAVDKQTLSNSSPASSAETKESQLQNTFDSKSPSNPKHQLSLDSSAVPSSQADSKGSGRQVTAVVDKQLPFNFPPASGGTKASQSQSTADNKNTSNLTHQSTTHKSSAVSSGAVDKRLSSNSPPASNAGTKESQSQSTIDNKNATDPTHQSIAHQPSTVSSSQATGAIDKQLSSNSPSLTNAGTKASQPQSTVDKNATMHQSTVHKSSGVSSSQIDPKGSGRQISGVVDKELSSNTLPATNAGTKASQSQSTVDNKNASNPTHQSTAHQPSTVSSSQATGAIDKQLSSYPPPGSYAGTKASQPQSTVDNKTPNNPTRHSRTHESSTVSSSQIDPKVSGRQVVGR